MPQQPPPQISLRPQAPKKETDKVISGQERKELASDKAAQKALEFKTQSKPPSEEALEKDDPVEKDGAVSPMSQGSQSSKTSGRKVKVALPLVSSAGLARPIYSQSEKQKGDADQSRVSQGAPLNVKNTGGNVITQSQPSHARHSPEGVSSEASFAVATRPKTLAANAAAVTGTGSPPLGELTKEEVEGRRRDLQRTARPRHRRKAKRAVSAESGPGKAARDKAARSETPPSDTSYHVPMPAENTSDTEALSVKSAESKTLSSCSSLRNSPPSASPNKTPPNRNTSGSHSRHHSEVSGMLGSPVKKSGGANNKPRPVSQAENAVGREIRIPINADQDSFKFTGDGRGTVRGKKAWKRQVVGAEGSAQGRDTALMGSGLNNRPAARSIDSSDDRGKTPNACVSRTDAASKTAMTPANDDNGKLEVAEPKAGDASSGYPPKGKQDKTPSPVRKCD
ncbi:uncharacterized protein MAM_02078 [Metarhizium album ARSEF 1941]|uniref:Uncharacterized protein n=1 Tax=Metarhizium album (strain ARSEF 1941) TaxID=1081103 RepID=A0A0B2X402_METAS|nr:uncharacterized protein MAM_02078 [Metarhizium album ARSEF 1941]KHO00155.1 hypothetical protein MAM_02078 [Metarhizium album ARSEF 1941]